MTLYEDWIADPKVSKYHWVHLIYSVGILELAQKQWSHCVPFSQSQGDILNQAPSVDPQLMKITKPLIYAFQMNLSFLELLWDSRDLIFIGRCPKGSHTFDSPVLGSFHSVRFCKLLEVVTLGSPLRVSTDPTSQVPRTKIQCSSFLSIKRTACFTSSSG